MTLEIVNGPMNLGSNFQDYYLKGAGEPNLLTRCTSGCYGELWIVQVKQALSLVQWKCLMNA